MIILEDSKLIDAKFVDEQEVEDLVMGNSEHFFGPSSIFVSKKKIKTISALLFGFLLSLAGAGVITYMQAMHIINNLP